MKLDFKSQLDDCNMTRYELAKTIGVTYPTIDKMYKGKTNAIKFDNLEMICNALNCSPNDILLHDNGTKYSSKK